MDANDIFVSLCDHPSYIRYRMEASCLELALEGERLCKTGDCRAGVSFFEAAVQVGTEDLKILSAIYSQLGNAYFYLHDYSRALEYHHHDLTLARTIGDRLGEAKASGNLGNTFKVLRHFDEAIVCCQRHLDISRELRDKVGEARALYNLGNAYHAKGKSLAYAETQNPGDFPEEVIVVLQKASDYYEANLAIVKELGDRAAQGRAYGNLGNTHYLLGNFRKAVESHKERLKIAKEFGDKSAERRASSNLGNAFVFLGEFEIAAEYYKRTLHLARQLKDRAVEAQACYSLGNTYTLLQDYKKAIEYHLKHLIIAQELADRVGEGRACWSLGNAYTALGDHEQAVHFAEKHFEISKEVGDRSGELAARMNLSDLQMVLGISYSANNSILATGHKLELDSQGARPSLGRRQSMEKMELMKLTPDKVQNWNSEILVKQKPALWKPSTKLLFLNRFRGKNHKSNSSSAKALKDINDARVHVPQKRINPSMVGDEGFFDLLCRFQSNRMDDQRYSFTSSQKGLISNTPASSTPSKIFGTSPQTGEFLDLLASSQSRRLDDQRASTGNLPGLRVDQHNYHSVFSHLITSADSKEPDDSFFDMLVKCQGARLDDQRCAPPQTAHKCITVPDEDFFSLILRSQAKRMNEQRVALPSNVEEQKRELSQ
ncbi:G-protein-signaling modulator 2 isoform X1 [Stegostoma tigrinum]|uniref:G-protein-signaling modulator 2 isoform X1 n=1 Tax=Stegostoma tigrinum TaxID=3053191 RepID=UPI0028708282|nr:G-protein-signaling modulator 2 isoform X1 [Stegostoma tigrinum]XP_059503786.1 G-protein-signaling modulator 2 isoform X1 [Stegostoma tigrinum]XP_059503787.1 G-protein-signaling modulator 2 isoform X1 [Stegostoma tigrinum]XP_059503788.1 G-protein-signaling modulator 2 isoform X1 [Stegostoma tigrinum]XP_059503789.1 G-protein-signaling modulator 2 isoform X1 [Stegostoma tigrinum]XP_059503790.1 G-protein-signaling modulator 2 isoform X1 [Stegostoma tigrinum]